MPADGVWFGLVAAQADDHGGLRLRLQLDVFAVFEYRRHHRRDWRRLAFRPLPPAPGADAVFTLAAVSLALLGFKSHVAVLYFLVTVAGATTIGSQILLYAYVAQFYPTAIRSTALGWSSGVGRIGAILGPVLGGALLAMQLSHQMNFLAFVVPGALAVIAIMLTAGRKKAV